MRSTGRRILFGPGGGRGGLASVLSERDRVAATYRGHGHALALGVDAQGLLDEMLGPRDRDQRRASRAR